MARIKVGTRTLSAYDEGANLDFLRTQIDEIEKALVEKGATHFETEYESDGYGSGDQLVIEGYREQTQEELDAAKRQEENARNARVASLKREIARLEGLSSTEQRSKCCD